MKKTVSMTINGAPQSHEVEPRLLLVHYIRELAGLTGTHVGCDTSQCGACTVHVNGVAVKSCTLLSVQCDGAQVMTIEGLAKDGKLHPIQEGFWEKHGLQCGFCTPGMIMSVHQMLQRNPRPTEAQIRHDLGLCGSLAGLGWAHSPPGCRNLSAGMVLPRNHASMNAVMSLPATCEAIVSHSSNVAFLPLYVSCHFRSRVKNLSSPISLRTACSANGPRSYTRVNSLPAPMSTSGELQNDPVPTASIWLCQ